MSTEQEVWACPGLFRTLIWKSLFMYRKNETCHISEFFLLTQQPMITFLSNVGRIEI